MIALLCICVGVYFVFPKPPCSIESFDKRAVWISYQDLSQLSYTSKKEFQKDFKKILNTVKPYKTNTLIVQVRAFSDALYPSKLFPLSQVITHLQSLSFDPLKEMITMTHDEGLLFEAWINPYRISLNQRTYEQFLSSPKVSWLKQKDQVIQYHDYSCIFNPASSMARSYIVDGVKEVVKNYDVDGIHFDDYFYVDGTHGKTTLEQRQDYVNILISDVYYAIKNIKQDVTFGISPQGNYENCITDGADIDTWLQEEGYVDYIMPQIYWSNQYGQNGTEEKFSECAKKFSQLKRHPHVKIYAGLAMYKTGKKLEDDQGWSLSSDNLSKQVQILSEKGYDGYSLFGYSSMQKKSGIKEMDELLRVHP